MFSQCPPAVRQIDVQQTLAFGLGSLRRVLTLFSRHACAFRSCCGSRCSCAIDQTIKPHAAVSLSLPPNTGDNVQAWAADDPEDDDLAYIQVTCLACAQAHLVNPKTGKVLGSDDE